MQSKEAANQYITKLQDQYRLPADRRLCQNQFVNDLMSLYEEQQQEKIDLQTTLDIPSDICIDEVDLCIVLGNLMKNAIDACIRLEHGRYIR